MFTQNGISTLQVQRTVTLQFFVFVAGVEEGRRIRENDRSDDHNLNRNCRVTKGSEQRILENDTFGSERLKLHHIAVGM
jgi:hypothetical protein